MRITIIILFFIFCFKANAQADSIINYEYLTDTSGNVIDSMAIYYLIPDTSNRILYNVRYKAIDRSGNEVYATLTPKGDVSYLSKKSGNWLEATGNGKIRIFRFTGLQDIDGNDIYEKDILIDKTGVQHIVYFRNGCFRYGLPNPNPLDSVLYYKAIFTDSLHLK